MCIRDRPYLYAMPDVMYDVYDVKGYEQVLNTLGQEVEITRDRERILEADKVILPGVGAFGDAMGRCV